MRIRWVLLFASAQAGFQAAAQESSSAEQQFEKLCSACHGSGGSGTDRGPALVNNRRLRSSPENEIQDVIRNGAPRGMPAFSLPESELQSLTRFVRSLSPPDDQLHIAGETGAGERFFFGKVRRGYWHRVR